MTEEMLRRVVRDFDPSAGVIIQRVATYGTAAPSPAVILLVNRLRWWWFGKRALHDRLVYVLKVHYVPAGVAVIVRFRE